MEMEPSQKTMMEMTFKAEIVSEQLLPDDLLLEIVARCPTIADAIRCAATSKPIRRGILNAGFLRGFLSRSCGGVDRDPCFPSLLLGMYHQAEDPRLPPVFVPVANNANYPRSMTTALPPPPAPASNHNNTNECPCEFGPYWPVAFRRSLLVLRRKCKVGVALQQHGRRAESHGNHPAEFTVCNPTTGERWVLPRHDVDAMSQVLLDVDPLAGSFKLLVAKLTWSATLFVQIFSTDSESGGGAWGPVLACHVSNSCTSFTEAADDKRPKPVIVDDTVHWLCYTKSESENGFLDCILTWRWHGDDGGGHVPHTTSFMKLPSRCRPGKGHTACLAALPSSGATSRPLLSVILVDPDTIVVWVRADTGDNWSLRHRIHEKKIARPLGLECPWLLDVEFPWFCEGSATVFLRERGKDTGPLLLSLDYKAPLFTQTQNSTAVSKLQVQATGWDGWEPKFCPYEVDLLSYMLFMMKPF
ncbi:hypothetical protein EJB05_05943, partial [Eragrostis curvula]